MSKDPILPTYSYKSGKYRMHRSVTITSSALKLLGIKPLKLLGGPIRNYCLAAG